MVMNEAGPVTLRAKLVYLLWQSIPRVLLLAMIVVIALLVVSVQEQKQAIEAKNASAVSQERPPVNVVLMELKPATIRDSINLPGSIEPWTRLTLAARVSGAVEEVLVEEGDEVARDTILARIDPADYTIALDRARAAYRQARASYEREKAIYDKGVIPTSQMEVRETDMITAKADLDAAELQLSRCTIKAPMGGVIQRLDVKKGLLLSVGDPVAEILKIDRVKAVIGIPESDITAVRNLRTVAVTVKALETGPLTGTVHFISPAPETAARLYRMELALENPDRSLLPGMFVRAGVVKQTIHNAVAIPLYSVISRNSEHYVFVEENGVARKRAVVLGIMEDWMVQATSGLSPGDKLVVEGHRDIENNQAINPVSIVTARGDNPS